MQPVFLRLDPIPASSGGHYLPPEPLIKESLDKFREAPLIGLEYIIEILRPRQEPIYKCMICKKSFDSLGVVADVVSTNHRLGYLVIAKPEHIFAFLEIVLTINDVTFFWRKSVGQCDNSS